MVAVLAGVPAIQAERPLRYGKYNPYGTDGGCGEEWARDV